jgi:cytochrome c oxidase cbb3-type subunit I/II
MEFQTPSFRLSVLALALPLSIGGAQVLSAQMAQGAGNPHAGEASYKRNCIGCHGPRGDGQGNNARWIEPKPRDFTEALFKCRSTPTGTLPTDNDLEKSITRGFVTTNMPSWRPLTEETRQNLVAYIKTFSPKWITQPAGTPITIPPETPVTTASILRGRQTFQKVECWKCHGPAGHGDGPAANALTDSKELPIRPYNFSASARFKCGSTNTDLYRVFMTGLDGTPMPSFADQLKPNEAWDLVHFLRTLQPAESPESMLWEPYRIAHAAELPAIGPDAAAATPATPATPASSATPPPRR